MTSLSWDAVLAWRLERQHLAARAPRAQALDVVSDIAGLHAQVASCAELTLWARVDGLKRGDVDALLWKRRSVVKTWAMRGTLHLLPAAELPRYAGALARLLVPNAAGGTRLDRFLAELPEVGSRGAAERRGEGVRLTSSGRCRPI